MNASAPLMDVVQATLANRGTKLQGAMALKLIQSVAEAPQAVAASPSAPPAVPVKVAPSEGSTVHVIA